MGHKCRFAAPVCCGCAALESQGAPTAGRRMNGSFTSPLAVPQGFYQGDTVLRPAQPRERRHGAQPAGAGASE